MPPIYAGARAWFRTPTGKKLTRFAATSVVSTIISETVIVVVYGFRLVPDAVMATLTGNLVAMVPAYFLNRTWAWGKTGKSHWRREVMPYVAMTALGIAVSLLGASKARHLVRTHHWAHLINTALVGGTNLVSFGVFWILKMVLFNRIFRTAATD